MKKKRTSQFNLNRIDRSVFSDIKEKFAVMKIINHLAKHYNVDIATIKKVLIEVGIDPYFYKKQDNKTKENAVQYYQEGHSVKECCNKYNISYCKLVTLLRKRGLYDTEKNVVCRMCNALFTNNISFSKHIKHTHKLKSKEYYDTFCKKSTEGNCGICNEQTLYIDITVGYKPYCSRSCAAKEFRERLRNDPIRYNEFVNKVKDNATKMHANMDPVEKQRRIQKITDKVKARNSLLTDKERKEKFGYINKLSPVEKNDFIQNVLLQTGCHSWWKRASDEKKLSARKKKTNTAIQKYINKGKSFEEFKSYRTLVNIMTKDTYKKYKKVINPNSLPRRRGTIGYHVDHKYSTYQGFLDGLSAEIISSKHNLHMLPGSENLSKHVKCCITKEELIRLYEQEKNSEV